MGQLTGVMITRSYKNDKTNSCISTIRIKMIDKEMNASRFVLGFSVRRFQRPLCFRTKHAAICRLRLLLIDQQPFDGTLRFGQSKHTNLSQKTNGDWNNHIFGSIYYLSSPQSHIFPNPLQPNHTNRIRGRSSACNLQSHTGLAAWFIDLISAPVPLK